MVTQMTADEIFQKHPTRFKKSEKKALRETIKAKMKELGYTDDEIQEIKAQGVNLAVGNPDAEYIFTAHYDTPGRTGWMLHSAWLWGQTGANIFMMIAVAAVLYVYSSIFYFAMPWLSEYMSGSDLAFVLFELGLVCILIIMFFSMFIKNKNNRNDNTSGVLSLLSLAEKVSADPELKSKCRFVFFDNEEWGLLGSSGFANYGKKNIIGFSQKKVINFDCVGYGDVLTFVAKRRTPVSKAVTDAFTELGQKPVFKRSLMIFMSDHANFKNSVMVSYTVHSKLGLLYLPKIHSSKDTECSVEQINKLTDDFYSLVSQGRI